MVTIGSDSHKSTHTFVAADGNGRELGQKTVKATSEGHLEGLRWASKWAERRWALEDCRHLSRRLEADLLRAGETVVRVSPKLMAGARQGARTTGKSDPIDALAVARFKPKRWQSQAGMSEAPSSRQSPRRSATATSESTSRWMADMPPASWPSASATSSGDSSVDSSTAAIANICFNRTM